MAITAALVKELRDSTGAGMMDAKKALTETDGDMEAAVDWLRTKGLAKAAKKSGRTAAEGLVAVAVKDGKGIAVEVNSETDFVGKNSDFQKMVSGIAEIALTVDDVDALKAADMGGKSVEQTVTDAVAIIGENMSVRRMSVLSGDVIILDNLSSHKSTTAAATMEAVGAWFLFLPPYSPDLNPIEMAFAKLKALIRRAAARTYDELWQAVGHVCNIFTEEECYNFFKAAGYETD